jgi:predicted nucleic acid-binding protein
VSIVTATELELGVHLAADEEIRARRLATLNALRSTYVPLPIDDAVGQAFAGLVASLRRAGTRIGVQDAWIAATARAHGAGICTQDEDFDVVPGLAIIRV